MARTSSATSLDVGYQTSYAIFGQLNIPVVGPEMGIPFVERFLIELGYRYDNYENLEDPVYVRKIAANWTLGYGFTLRGAWGKSFRVPSFAEAGARSRVAGLQPVGIGIERHRSWPYSVVSTREFPAPLLGRRYLAP